MNSQDFISALYRGVLLREPDPRGLEHFSNLIDRNHSPAEVVKFFLQSPEFRAKASQFVPYNMLDGSPPMRVDLDTDESQEQRLWNHMEKVWSTLGFSEPYWSVLTEDSFRTEKMTQELAIDEFYGTGRASLDRLDRWLARNYVSVPESGTCAEYGCGVGRVTVWLARRFSRILAFDISEPHLKLARQRADLEGLRNIEFIHVKSRTDLRRLRGLDFFYSIIVLQHNPPPIIAAVLRRAFEGLKQDGLAFFQAPTYALGYTFDIESYLSKISDRGMEMHYVPQHAIMDIAWKHHLKLLEVSPDNYIGKHDTAVSSSFLLKKAQA